MDKIQSSRSLVYLLGIAMIVGGVALAGWALYSATSGPQPTASSPEVPPVDIEATALPEASAVESAESGSGSAGDATEPGAADRADADGDETPIPLRVELGPAAAISLDKFVRTAVISDTTAFTETDAFQIESDSGANGVIVRLDTVSTGGEPAYQQIYVPATRFDTIEPGIRWRQLQNAWRGRSSDYDAITVITDTLPALTQVLGEPGAGVSGVATVDDAVAAAWQVTPTLAILPFDQLVPSLTVLPIDGQNPVGSADTFTMDDYPLAATIYAHKIDADDGEATPSQSARAADFLAQLPETNRRADRLTTIAMTGVTAMVRGTAAKMDEFGPEWASEVVGPRLSEADITHISNEVPFVPDCKTNTDPENLTFCSKPEYMAALEAVGTDIIGLTGNHQNDYGYDDAITSLEIYEEAGLPVYGGGEDGESARRPLLLEHNGNKLAFLGANSFGPRFAWATEFYPGSARFDLNIMSATIRELKEEGLADVVLTELQYQERYNVEPLGSQRLDFGALARAGADIVTGVQSHVPQATEFVDGRLILHGLGNLFFDQMWEEETREGLIAIHTIYDGRHINTQLLTTMLHDYGQPQWTTPEENEQILQRVFDASYWEY